MRNGPSGFELKLKKLFGENTMKNTITTLTLAIVLTFGATFANAGIIVTDRSDQAAGIIVTDLANTGCNSTERRGIIVTDIFGTMASLAGIIVTDLTGIIVTDLSGNSGKCTDTRSMSRDGIIVTDRAAGIIVTD